MSLAGFFLCNVLLGQSAFLPQNLGATVNSSYDEINPVLSPDGKILYFVRVNHPENTYGAEDSEDIWYSQLKPDGSWSAAIHLPALNTARYNAVLSCNSNGIILINGIYNKKGTFWKKRGLSTATIAQGVWSAPQMLRVKRLSRLNRGLKSSGMMSADSKYIVLSFSRAYNSKRSNLFYCTVKPSGKYNRLRPLRTLNTMLSEDAPFLSTDNKTLYFSSDREAKGQYSIYKTSRSLDDWKTWSKPIKLSDTINSNGWDSYFKTNAKGSWAYFSSTEKSLGGADLYKIKLFEENPFIVITGRILHAQNKRPLLHKDIKLTAGTDSKNQITVNPDSATYYVKLPLGKLYQLTAITDNYSPAIVTIDATKIKEFKKVQQDILIGPQAYVLVKGRLLDQDKKIIPHEAKPSIIIDGVKADSVVIDTLWGSYSLRMKFGAAHKIQVEANGYASVADTIDLSVIDEYQVVNQDLFAEEDRVATIAGKVLDKKTNSILKASVPVAIKVEGVANAHAPVDSLTREYSLKLPLAKTYTLSASAPGYYPLYETVDLNSETKSVHVSRDLVIVPIEVGQSIRLNNIFFETGKAVLKSESFSELDRVANFLRDNPDLRIEIGGHTDNVGKPASNQKLSEARAAAVAKYIVSKGLLQQNIVSKGYGSSKPVAENTTKEGKAQNRRVEFTILDK
ncbi:MAG TPA: OmpA family protein [Cyclobacteriaceae bacterium]